MSKGFWSGRSVFLTGHTGFMGGWLAAYLIQRGACVHGYALAPATEPSFFAATGLADRLNSSVLADIGNLDLLCGALDRAAPSVVFHLAAQPLVRHAHAHPLETVTSNVLGTANLLEAARRNSCVQAVAVVTTDKVYRNLGRAEPYTEDDELGGREPYSASKAASELIVDAWYHSYLRQQGTGVATVRTGNIFGGGDWAQNRLVPDAIRCFSANRPLVLRNPSSTRPWQHVLDPVWGYLVLAENLLERPEEFSGKWNFGPAAQDCRPVVDLARLLVADWPGNAQIKVEADTSIFEERLLALDSSKASARLGWTPRWTLEDGVEQAVGWYQSFAAGADMWKVTIDQIDAMERSAAAA